MNSDKNDFGGSISVDGQAVEVDMAAFGWDPEARRGPEFEQPEGDERVQRDPADDDGRVRLQKALAHAGIASRRACEALITGGRVTVNGEVEMELGSRVDPTTDDVRVDGVVVQLDVSKRYFVLNKPRGVVSTMSDENGRPDLREFTDEIEDRLYNVGRLDTDTSGLLILTNDGELAHRLAHPSFGVQKTYIAKVRGRFTPATLQQLRDGIELTDGFISVDRAKILPGGSNKTHSLVEVTLHSGRNRIVRRMLAAVGHPVEELVRRQFGPLNLGTLGIGEMRELSSAEQGALLSAVADGSTEGLAQNHGGGRKGGKGQNGGKPAGQNGQNDKNGRGNQHRGQGNGQGSRQGDSGQNDKKSGKPGKRGSQAGKASYAKGITAGRPGDGKGARGMRGIAAKGNPHGRRNQQGGDR